MRTYRLFTMLPKQREIGIGTLSVSREGDARFFSGNGERDARLLADMERARLMFVAANGVMLSGFEQIGLDKRRVPKYRYQEWWLAYHTQETDQCST